MCKYNSQNEVGDDNRSLRENGSYGLLNDNRTAHVYTVELKGGHKSQCTANILVKTGLYYLTYLLIWMVLCLFSMF